MTHTKDHTYISIVILYSCTISYGFLLPHAEVTEPLHSMYRSTGRDARAIWLMTRNAGQPPASRHHVVDTYEFPTQSEIPYKEDGYEDSPDLYLSMDKKPFTSVLTDRQKRGIGANSRDIFKRTVPMKFTRRVRNVPNVIVPMHLGTGGRVPGEKQARALWLPNKKNNVPEVNVNHPQQIQERASWLYTKKSSSPRSHPSPDILPDFTKIENRASWLPNKRAGTSSAADNTIEARANWLQVKRLPPNDVQVLKPDVRANWLPVKKDKSESLENAQHVKIETRAHWLPAKRTSLEPDQSDESHLGYPDNQGIETRASWLPNKRTEKTDDEALEELEDDHNAINTRASWLPVKKNVHSKDSNNINIGGGKRAQWLPNKRLPDGYNILEKRARWLLTKKKKSESNSKDTLDDQERLLRVDDEGKSDNVINLSGSDHSQVLQRGQRSLSRSRSQPLTVSPMGHFINGRSYRSNSRQGSGYKDYKDNANAFDKYGDIFVTHAEDIEPQYVEFNPDDEADDEYGNDFETSQLDNRMNKRMPTSRAVSDHEKLGWDVYNTRAMWLPTREIAGKRMPTNRDVHYAEKPYHTTHYEFIPNTYRKRIPTLHVDNQGYNHQIPEEGSIHARIPTARALYSGGLLSMYDTHKSPYRHNDGNQWFAGQYKRMPTERDLYSHMPTTKDEE